MSKNKVKVNNNFKKGNVLHLTFPTSLASSFILVTLGAAVCRAVHVPLVHIAWLANALWVTSSWSGSRPLTLDHHLYWTPNSHSSQISPVMELLLLWFCRHSPVTCSSTAEMGKMMVVPILSPRLHSSEERALQKNQSCRKTSAEWSVIFLLVILFFFLLFL